MATQRTVPAALVVKELEVAVPPPLSVTGGEVKAGAPVQVGAVGGTRGDVKGPVGGRRGTVAVAVMGGPTMTVVAEGVVAIVAVARPMVTGSTVQPEVMGVLLASPG